MRVDEGGVYPAASIGAITNTIEPETINEEKTSFASVNDDVAALCWLPESATDLLAATYDSLLICDIRAYWSTKPQIEE